MSMTPRRTFASAALFLAAAFGAVAKAQFVGGNPTGSMVLVPLDPETATKRAGKTAEQRRVERLTAQRLRRLDAVRKRRVSAMAAAEKAEKASDADVRARRWGAALRRADSARTRLDRLRRRYKKDKHFMVHADRIAFEVRIDISRFRRELKKAEADVAKSRLKSRPKSGAGSTASKPSSVPAPRIAPDGLDDSVDTSLPDLPRQRAVDGSTLPPTIGSLRRPASRPSR